MKIDFEKYKLLQKFAKPNEGFFTIYDLKNLFLPKSKVALYNEIKHFEKAGILRQFCRGIYIFDEAPLEVISQRICPQSYVSFGNILAEELMIGTIPKKALWAVKLGPSRRYASPEATLIHLGITPDLFFGYTIQEGIKWADKEKALLDTLYYYQKGTKFSFNIFSDIYTDDLNERKICSYLSEYKNSKFQKFVEGYLSERN